MNADFDLESLPQNPYASPQSIEPARPVELPIAVWAQQERVIAHRQAAWPRVCVLTGVEGHHYLDLTIETHYPFWLLLIFVGCFATTLPLVAFLVPMPYTPMGVIGALIANAIAVISALVYFARPAKLRIYLSSMIFERRRSRLRIAMLLNGGGFAAMIGSFFLGMNLIGPVFILGLISIVIGGRMQRRWNMILQPIKMAREYTVLRGAGTAFLAGLPQWPFGAV